MPVYQYQNKDGTKLWKFRAYAEDVFGNRKQSERKGFITKKEAQLAEMNFKLADKSEHSNMTFYELWLLYKEEKELKLKKQSFRTINSRKLYFALF